MLKTLIFILSILRVAFVGDPQVDNEKELSYARASIYSELRERKDLDLVIILGDLVNDKPSLIAASKASLDSLPCPWICTPGNHDKDVHSKESQRPRDTRTFRQVLGYTDTAFVFSGVNFICMDNVRTVDKASYEGGLRETQKTWLEEALKQADGRIVLCSHIPFSAMKGRDSLSAMLAPYAERLLMVCGHTHSVRRSQSGYGCEEVLAGATCGSWWRGVKDRHGIPIALMNCGAPRGYFVADFNPREKNWYSLEYKCVGRNAEDQLSATVRDGKLFVNVYGGSTEGKVCVKLKGRWIPLEPASEPCPEVQEIIEFNRSASREYRRAHKEEFIPMRRLRSPHVWSCGLQGEKRIRIRYSDATYRRTLRKTVRTPSFCESCSK